MSQVMAAPKTRAVPLAAPRVYDPAAVSRRFVMIGSLILLGLLLAGWTAFLPAGECRTSAPLPFAPDTEITMNVRGTSCPIRLRSGTASVNDLYIWDEPANGTVAPRGRTGIVYRPARDFKGEDFFAFAMKGQSASHQGTAIVRVRVVVR